MNAEEHIKKGTTTVGIVCKEGIVLAADKRATLGGRIVADKKVDKVVKLTDHIAITTAGSVSDIQLVIKLINAELNLKKIRTKKEVSVEETAHLMSMMVYNNIRKFSVIPGITAFLLGGMDKTGMYLFEIAPDGSLMKEDSYKADGSGFMMALGVLDTLYEKNLSLSEGIKLSVKAINAAIQRDTATGEGIDVFTVTKDGVKKVFSKQLDLQIKI